MMLLIWSFAFFLFILILMLAIFGRSRDVIAYDIDDGSEIETTTVTTITTPAQVATVGTIYAYQKLPDATWYVVDPVDSQETEVNANDDYYRDAGGKVWSLM